MPQIHLVQSKDFKGEDFTKLFVEGNVDLRARQKETPMLIVLVEIIGVKICILVDHAICVKV